MLISCLWHSASVRWQSRHGSCHTVWMPVLSWCVCVPPPPLTMHVWNGRLQDWKGSQDESWILYIPVHTSGIITGNSWKICPPLTHMILKANSLAIPAVWSPWHKEAKATLNIVLCAKQMCICSSSEKSNIEIRVTTQVSATLAGLKQHWLHAKMRHNINKVGKAGGRQAVCTCQGSRVIKSAFFWLFCIFMLKTISCNPTQCF